MELFMVLLWSFLAHNSPWRSTFISLQKSKFGCSDILLNISFGIVWAKESQNLEEKTKWSQKCILGVDYPFNIPVSKRVVFIFLVQLCIFDGLLGLIQSLLVRLFLSGLGFWSNDEDPGLPWSPVTMTGGSEGKLAPQSWECSFFSSLLPLFIFRFLFVLLLGGGWGKTAVGICNRPMLRPSCKS